MILDVSWWVWLLMGLALAVGALVQGTVGLGLGLVAAPVLTLLAPDLMPGLILFLTLLLPVITLAEGRSAADVRGLLWALPPRIPGTVLGAWLVVQLDQGTLGLAIGAMVLLAVVASAVALPLPLRRETLVVAGFVSGITGTVSSIGGPPLALLYQRQPLDVIRQTLAVYFVAGALLSLGALGVGGELSWGQLALAGLLAPFVVGGFLLAPLLRRRVPPHRVRPAVLVVCGFSAVVLLVRSLLTW
ncbi:sulfite exporter TauE/SafE family protein [Desertihabitans aurantiacus]|uniref:sulfite exporter TauE/SafE family protein n=1 Tax=Desertihabitans aurantiacus TaxID=2282477 RepID=UPI001E5ACE89|nr:sulfite exporter TauE/SafE family protein [Desertihabitans aurantiacus]